MDSIKERVKIVWPAETAAQNAPQQRFVRRVSPSQQIITMERVRAPQRLTSLLRKMEFAIAITADLIAKPASTTTHVRRVLRLTQKLKIINAFALFQLTRVREREDAKHVQRAAKFAVRQRVKNVLTP